MQLNQAGAISKTSFQHGTPCILFNFYFFYRMQLEQNNTEDPNSMTDSLPEQGKNYWALILGLLCVVVVFGNVLVIASVVREKVLQNVTNFFIVSLAVADLLVAGCVMPFSVYVLVSSNSKGVARKPETNKS